MPAPLLSLSILLGLAKMAGFSDRLQASVPIIVETRRFSNSSSGTSPEVEDFEYITDSTGYVDPKSLGSEPITGFTESPELDDGEFPSVPPGIWHEPSSCEACLAAGPTHGWIVERPFDLDCPVVRSPPSGEGI